METLFDINYGVVVFSKKETELGLYNILHFAGFETPPTDSDINHIREEALYDEDFKLINEYDESDIYAVEADKSTVDKYRNIVKEQVNQYNKDVNIRLDI